MSYIKNLSCKILFIVTALSISIQAEEIKNSTIDPYQLHQFICDVADRLYCQAELDGGGSHGENYKKVIDKNIEEFTLLLKQEHAFINYQNNNEQRTPLMLAAYYHIWEFIEILLENGAETSLTEEHDLTALMCVKKGASWGMLGSIKWIVMFVMQDYYTKERHNKCVDLLAKNKRERIWYHRWI